MPLGFIALSDELRPDAYATLSGFAAAGVHLKIISGDSPGTVLALAAQAGLLADSRAVSGLDLGGLDDEQLGDLAEKTTVFGRITPHQKERLVRALRARGHYVAMIGDGVNDVLSLKQAHLGTAWTGGDVLSGDRRPTALALLLLGAFGVVLAVPELRAFFDLVALEPSGYAFIGLVAAAWALVVRWTWRSGLVDRAFARDHEVTPALG